MRSRSERSPVWPPATSPPRSIASRRSSRPGSIRETAMNEEQLLWQSQGPDTTGATADELRKRMEELERKTRLRNRGGYQVCAFLFVAFLWWMTLVPNLLVQIGSVLSM